MKQFSYVITDPVGIHARPAGMLVKAAKALDSTITIEKTGGKSRFSACSFCIIGQAHTKSVQNRQKM